MPKNKIITTEKIVIDDEGCPSQEIYISGSPAGLWYIEGENEPVVSLESELRLSELKALLKTMEEFDKQTRIKLKKHVKKAHRPLVFSTVQIDKKTYIWFACQKEWKKRGRSREDDSNLLTDYHGQFSDASQIEKVFADGKIQIVCENNGNDGISLEFRVVTKIPIKKLEAFAKSRLFLTDKNYDKHVKDV